MNFNKTNIPCVDEGACNPYGAEPDAALTAMMDVANNLSEECLHMARRLNEHMFGIGQPNGEPTGQPRCFRDLLSLQMGTLKKLRDELGQMLKEIGV